MMTPPNRLQTSIRLILGAGMLLLGAVLLPLQTRIPEVILGATQADSAIELLTSLPDTVLRALHSGTDAVFSHPQHAYFAVAWRLLVSFWPLAILVAGAALLFRPEPAVKPAARARS